MMARTCMIIQGSYGRLFCNNLVGTKMRRGCVIIPTENKIISQVNNGGEDIRNCSRQLYWILNNADYYMYIMKYGISL